MIINKDGYYEDRNLGLIHRHSYKLIHKSIPKNWIVHHINGIKTDNAIDNLIALPAHFHDRLHGLYRLNNLPDVPTILKLLSIYNKETQDLENELVKINKRMIEINYELKKRKKIHFKPK